MEKESAEHVFENSKERNIEKHRLDNEVKLKSMSIELSRITNHRSLQIIPTLPIFEEERSGGTR